jgi:hypothetical protein
VGYWIYGMQASPHVSFWHLPGYIGCGLLVFGLIALAIGFFGGDPGSSPGISQRQRGGDNSTQIQSGRDTKIGRDD